MKKTIHVVMPSRVGMSQLEQALQVAEVHFDQDSTGHWHFQGEVLSVDLGHVKWMDLKAIAELAMVCYAVGREDGAVELRLPRDERASQFFAHSGFLKSLDECPTGPFRLSVEGATTDDRNYLSIFPLRWVTEPSQLSAFLEGVIRGSRQDRQEGDLLQPDAQALVDILLGELVENALVHSGSDAALIAGWRQVKAKEVQRADYLDVEHSYFDSLNRRSLRQLHLFIADAGVGIPYTMRKAYPDLEIEPAMEFAFDRWSSSVDTSAKRGTRGLYRVDRLAKRYRGIITVRCGRALFGNSHAWTGERSSFRRDDLASLPGSYLRLELPFSLPAIQRTISNADPVPVRYVRAHARNDDEDWELPRLLVNSQAAGSPWLIDFEDQIDSPDGLVDLLEELTEVAHPTPTIVTGLGQSDVVLEDICDSVNQIVESHDMGGDRHNTIVREPVLIVGSSFLSTFWTGAPPQVAEALGATESVVSDRITGLYLQGLEHAKAADDETASLTISGVGVHNALRERLHVLVKAMVPERRTTYITPSLGVVRGWVDLQRLLSEAQLSPSLAARIILTDLAVHIPDVVDRAPSLVFDNSIPEAYAEACGRLLHGRHSTHNSIQLVRPHDLDANRPLSLRRDRSVIILVGVAATEHTLRRNVAMVLRQGYDVLGLGALVDGRGNKRDTLDLWERKFPVTCTVHEPLIQNAPGKVAARHEFLTPGGQRESRHQRPIFPSSSEDVIKLLGSANAIHLGHFSGAVDRHFTFYVDAVRALSDQTCCDALVGPILKKILSWSAENGPLELLVYPDEEVKPGSPARRLAKIIQDRLKTRHDIQTKVTSRRHARNREGTVVHIDWGSISGESQMRALHELVGGGARSVLAVTLFSQLSPMMEDHLRAIRELQVETKRGKIEVWFLARLPVEAFRQEACPVCTHLGRDDNWANQHLMEEVTREEERLAPRPWRSSSEDEPLDRIATQFHGNAIEPSKALDIRRILSESLLSTHASWSAKSHVLKELRKDAFLRDMAALLVHEPQWLRRMPLADLQLREELAYRCVTLLLPEGTLSIGAIDDAERARLLICLRLVSKQMFVAHLSRLLVSLRENSALHNLCLYMASSILSREYSALTGLPAAIATSLANVLPEVHASGTIIEQLYKQADLLDTKSQIRLKPRWETWNLFRRRVLGFDTHQIYEPFSKLDPKRWDSRPEAILLREPWEKVTSWLTNRIEPYIEEFRDVLTMTDALSNSRALAAVFPENMPMSDLHRVTDALEADSFGISRPWDDKFLGIYDSTYEHLVELFGPARRLQRALEECPSPVFRIVQVLKMRLREAGISFKDQPTDASRDLVFLPTQFLRELIDQVVKNAEKRYDVKSATADGYCVAMVPSVGIRDLTLHFRSWGTRPGTRAGNRGLGGLEDLKQVCPERCDLDWDFFDRESPPYFEVWIRAERVPRLESPV
jgi:hypothetical protein